MSVDSSYLILFLVNLVFIVTHLYGWLLKMFFRPADISVECGFSSPTSMAKAFKSQGMNAPSSYRNISSVS